MSATKKKLEICVTPEQLSAVWQVHKNTVLTKIKKGELHPVIALSANTFRIPLSTIAAYEEHSTIFMKGQSDE